MEGILGIFKDKDLRRRVLVVFGFLALFRLLSVVPVPTFDPARIPNLASNNFLGFLNIFSGGGLERVSIMMLGVGPYITSSIIMQLLTMIFPSLKEMYQEDGEAGRRKFNQYSRLLTVPLAFLQGYALLSLLSNPSQGIIPPLTGFEMFIDVLIVAAGSMLLVWIGELVSEHGIGNGVSLIIFAGIVAGIPAAFAQTFFQLQQVGGGIDSSALSTIIGYMVIAPIVIAGVVLITEAERPIPISYAKRVRGAKMYGGMSTYLPLRVNQAGVIPIIFAISILLFPPIIGSFLARVSSNSFVLGISHVLTSFLNNLLLYGISYFLLVFLFTYFYTAVTFDPEAISSNLQKQGGFIPGIRPGPSTTEFLSKLITRITLVGAVFLGVIAVLPLIMQALFSQIQSLTIGGTALLIVVSVVLETIKQIRAQLTLREYD
ncbi:MAG: preprotein translocase subunit SecY [Patescibacteria group bacterium]